MPERHRAAVSALDHHPFRIAVALQRSLTAGYTLRDFRGDLVAGLIVGVVALPLSMALAIASGVPPQHGLYTAIIAGTFTALLGGSSVQVTGPTAAFVVILAPISAKFGLAGLAVATLMAGALLVIAGFCRLGRLIEFIPFPVVTGFTSGIAVVIATLQVKDFLGLRIEHMPESFIYKVIAIVSAVPGARAADWSVGLFTLAILVLLPRWTRSIPSPLVALPAAALLAAMLKQMVSGFDAETIATRFSYIVGGIRHAGIPQAPPLPGLPWLLPGPDSEVMHFSLPILQSLIGPAFAIAMLGAIESLLSAVVADGMIGLKHDPDSELIAQGTGNLLAPFFGGFAATGAIARTATNIRSGARSPVAAVIHSVFILAAVLLLAPILGYLPMASMAALLLVVAWNMSEAKHFFHLIRVAPGSDVFVLLTCFGLTVVFDMVIAVSVGVVLAALLLIRRIADLSSVKLVGSHAATAHSGLPPKTIIYEIGGPLFFGAAQRAMSSLRIVEDQIRTVIIDMSEVPAMDATGLVNLESALERLKKSHVFVILSGVQRQPLHFMARAGWKHRKDWLAIHRDMTMALALAWERSKHTTH